MKSIVLACDSCSRNSTGKKPVENLQISGDSAGKLEVDLCGACLKSMKREYGIHDRVRVRKSMKIVDIDDISVKRK